MSNANQNNRSMTESGPERSLSHKVSRGGIWVSAARVSDKVLKSISAIVLARLLTPFDFGLVAIAMTIMSFTQTFTQPGFESALIQKQEHPRDYLNTAWTFGLLRAVLLYGLVFVLAPLFASFFNEPKVISILRVIALSFILQSLRNIGIIYFRKNLDFGKLFVLQASSTLAYVIVVIPMAFLLKNAWALVLGSLASGVVGCLLSYVLHPYRPRLEFNLVKAKELFNFGRWILGTGVLAMLRTAGIDAFIGRFLGVPILGFYNRSQAFSNKLFTDLNGIMWQVGYPAYSKLQNRSSQLREAYIKTLQLVTFVGMPMAGGIFVLSKEFTHIFLTDKWLPIVPVMQVLCLLAVITLLNAPSGMLFQAVGKPAIGTKISLASIILLAGLIYPLASRWGLRGVAIALLLSTLFVAPITSYMAIKIAKCRVREYLKTILFPLINTSIMVLLVWVAKMHAIDGVGISGFVLLVGIGIVTYLLIAYSFYKYLNYGVFATIKQRLIALRER